MIYIKFNRDKFYINKNGETVYRMPHNNLAIFTDTSSVISDGVNVSAGYIATDTAERYRYYSFNKETGLYFLEQNIHGTGCRSLLHALNLRNDVVVGIYSSRRLILFYCTEGKLKKFRITSDDVDDPESEIQFTISKWGCQIDIPVEIYGYNLPFSKLYESIQKTPVFRDAESDRRRRQFIQIATGVVLILTVIYGYVGIKFYERSTQSKISRLKSEKQAITAELQAQAIKRLPLYLCSNNMPLDAILKELSFLENCKYTNIKIMASNDNITVIVTTMNAEDAYKIKQHIKNAKIKLTGGVIEISFSKDIQRDTDIFGGCNYSSYFAF